jgi:uncharacterized RDD family membrane protein YckC
LICPKCGADITGGAEVCRSCGEPAPDPSQEFRAPAAAATAVRRPVVFGGFWRRLAAYLFDSFLLFLFIEPLVLKPLMERNGISPEDAAALYNINSRQVLAINLLVALIGWVYWATLESSPWQATLGKRLFGLQVTGLDGRRVSFARATGRHFAKNLSLLMLGIGFFMIAFTEKKQGFHDMLAGCLVVRKYPMPSSS